MPRTTAPADYRQAFSKAKVDLQSAFESRAQRELGKDASQKAVFSKAASMRHEATTGDAPAKPPRPSPAVMPVTQTPLVARKLAEPLRDDTETPGGGDVLATLQHAAPAERRPGYALREARY